MEGLTGYPKEDFDSRTLKWTNLIVPEDRKECRSKFLEALRTNRSFMREYRIRRKDGALRWIQGRAQIFCDEAGRIDYVSGVLFDITERKLAEREILRFASFPRLNPNPVLEIDLVGKVTYANEYAYEVLRKLGRQDITGFLPSDLEDLIQSYREQGVKRFFREIELEGAVFAESIHVVEEFKMLRLFAVDITKHKQAEESLRDNQQFLTDIFNSIQDGMIILSLDFTIIRVNPALEKLPFVKPMVGRKCYEILHNRSEPCEECVAREVIQTGLAAEKIITVKADDRSTIFLEIHAFPLLNRTTGQVDQVIEFARNITNRKRAEEESLRFSKLESLSTLAGGIAHDFNNILTAILGNIGLAMLDQDMGDQGRQRLAAAEKACQQAQRLARQLLTFAKGGAPIKKIVSIAKLLKESASLILSGSKSRCNFSIPDDLWSVQADAGQINQVINNLLINADYAMPEGGVIEITAENILVERESKLPISKGQYVKFAIADRGIGISRKYLHKIFDPYFSTKQKGSGLGLATAYSIIKNHSGHIEVGSQIGDGTTFHIYLPAKEKGVSAAELETAKPTMGQGKVLVMDDEEMVRDVLGEILSRLGYEADFASDGSQAIEKFVTAKETNRPFSALIIDLTIPGGMGGKEAIKELLKIDPQVKAIVSSGYSDDPIMADFQKYGFAGVIAKPYKVAELGKVLNKVIIGEDSQHSNLSDS